MNTLIERLDFLRSFLATCQKLRIDLTDELIDNATDPVIRMRRFRMLEHLAIYESQTIEKIYLFDGDSEDWLTSSQVVNAGLLDVIHRSS